MNNKLVIEWKHLDKDGTTCDQCFATGKNLHKMIKRLRSEHTELEIKFKETKLSDKEIDESNTILFNGQPIEGVLGANINESHCESCSCITTTPVDCRTIEYKGRIYEEIPAELIREAALKIIGRLKMR